MQVQIETGDADADADACVCLRENVYICVFQFMLVFSICEFTV